MVERPTLHPGVGLSLTGYVVQFSSLKTPESGVNETLVLPRVVFDAGKSW